MEENEQITGGEWETGGVRRDKRKMGVLPMMRLCVKEARIKSGFCRAAIL